MINFIKGLTLFVGPFVFNAIRHTVITMRIPVVLNRSIITACLVVILFSSCKKTTTDIIATVTPTKVFYDWNKFVMGADLSYVSQVQDYGGKKIKKAIITIALSAETW